MVRARRLAYVMDAMVVGVGGLGGEGGGDAGQIWQRRPLGRPHGPVAKDAALGRSGGVGSGVLVSLREGDSGRSWSSSCRWLITCGRYGSCGSSSVER